jgi:hypothetical protein
MRKEPIVSEMVELQRLIFKCCLHPKDAEDEALVDRLWGQWAQDRMRAERVTKAVFPEIERLRAALLREVMLSNQCGGLGKQCSGWNALKCGCAGEARNAALSPSSVSDEHAMREDPKDLRDEVLPARPTPKLSFPEGKE